MAQPARQQQPAPAQQGHAARDLALVGTAGVAAVGALGALTPAIATAAILAAFVKFLAALREQHRAFLVRELGRYSSSSNDITETVRQEMLLELEFAKNAADRLAKQLPDALAIADPQERARRIAQIFADEERYAGQRGEAMFARAIAALTRFTLKAQSPAGAFWRLGTAQHHTPGCLTMADKFWPWEVLDRVHPPRHYGCLVSGTRVWGPGVKSAMSRWYEGEIICIAFRSGREIGITPNHPILQRKGWTAADALRVGDQVVCCSPEEARMRVGDPDEVQVPAAIEEVARALADAGDVEAVRVPVAAEYFHGDGGQGYVDVVRTGGLLDDRLVIADPKQTREFTFGIGDRAAALLARDSGAGECIVAVRFAAFGGVRGASLVPPLLGGEAALAELRRSGTIPQRHAGGSESAQHGRRGDAGSLGDAVRTFASDVATDEVVSVDRYPWCGHVHNLETREGWYSAHGIVVHNCTSSLHGYGEAILNGWMTPSDVPDTRAAINAASGVDMLGEEDAAALLLELDVRDRLLEAGLASAEALQSIDLKGVRCATEG